MHSMIVLPISIYCFLNQVHSLRSSTFHMQLVPDILYSWMSGSGDELVTQCISDWTKTKTNKNRSARQLECERFFIRRGSGMDLL